MKLNITTDTSDAELVAGFAAATGWTDKSGQSQTDWLTAKAEEWIKRTAVQGAVQLGTSTERDAYIAKLKTVQAAAITTIQKPPITPKVLAG